VAGSNVGLTLSQWQNKLFNVTGTLVAAVQINLPLSPNAIGGTPSVGGHFVVANNATGNFPLSIGTTTGGRIAYVPQGAKFTLISDGINVDIAHWTPQIGSLIEVSDASADPGYIPAGNQLVATARYPLLFAKIGYSYGGSGANFAMPDHRGRAGAGLDNLGGSSAGRITTLVTDSGTIVGTTLGSAGGSQSHSQTSAEIGAHAHTTTESPHAHGLFVGTGFGSQAAVLTAATPTGELGPGAPVDFATTGLVVNSAGSGNSMAWLQPTIIVNKLIYTGS
jgi:microcystin-dependent protein